MEIACLTGDLSTVNALLKAGAHYDWTTDPDGSTPLMYACWGGHLHVCIRLLELGADPNNFTQHTDPYFCLPLGNGFDTMTIVEMLEAYGGTYAYKNSLFRDRFYTMHKIIASKRNVMGDEHLFDNTLLHVFSHDVVVNWAMARGYDVNARNLKGYTPLCMMTLKGNVRGVLQLLRNGANPGLRDDDGKLPIELTANGFLIHRALERYNVLVICTAVKVKRISLRAPIRKLGIDLVQMLAEFI